MIKRNEKLFVIFLALNVLFSCRMQNKNALRAHLAPTLNLVEVIYHGPDYLIFFAGPVLFENRKEKSKALIDFTYHIKKDSQNMVDSKMTILTKNTLTQRTELNCMVNQTVVYKTRELDTMFTDKYRNANKYRFQFMLPYEVFRILLNSDDVIFEIEGYGRFCRTSNWKKDRKTILKKLDANIDFVKNPVK